MSLSQAVAVAQRENPEIRAAQKNREAVKARVSQAFTPDKPRLDVERMYAPRSGDLLTNAGEKNVAITQELPFPTTLYWKGRLSRREADMAEASYRAKELEVLSRVKSAYAALYLSRRAIDTLEENTGFMRQFAKVAGSKYASGKSSQGDVLKAQVELSKMLNMRVTVEQEEETSRALLNALLNRPPESPLAIVEDIDPKPLDLKLEELRNLSADHRPELQEAAAAVERGRAAVALGRSDYLPDLMLQYRQRDVMNGVDSRDAVVGFSLPLWFWKQGAAVREAKAERDMAEAEFKALQNMNGYDVKSLYVKAQTDYRLIELYRTGVLPQAEEALRVSRAAYESDKTDFLDLLDSVRSLRDFRLEHYQHIADYLQSLAELERVAGTPLLQEEKP